MYFKMSKLKYINKLLKEYDVPLESTYKLLIKLTDVNTIATICNGNLEFIDVCKTYKNEICQSILDDLEISDYKPEYACEIIKEINKLHKEFPGISKKDLLLKLKKI